jgi:uncharacterized protein (TIGR03067 family)
MKQTFILALAVGLFAASSLLGRDSANDDSQQLQGTWTLTSGEKDGEPLPEQVLKNSKLTIIGDAYTVQLGAVILKGTQKLHTTMTPKQIDARDTEGPTIGQNYGIYEITPTGDFRVCFAATGKDRPTDFVTTPGSGHFTHVWRRIKGE